MGSKELKDAAQRVKDKQRRRKRLLLIANVARDGYYKGEISWEEAQTSITPYIEALKQDNLDMIAEKRPTTIEDAKEQLNIFQYLPKINLN